MTLPFSQGLLLVTAISYCAAFVLHALSFTGVFAKGHRPAFFLMRLGFFLGTFYFGADAIEHGSFVPVANLSQALAFFAWSIAFVYLVLLAQVQSESFGLVLTPILSVLVLAACLFFNLKSKPISVPLNPAFSVHIVSAFFAYACFSLSFAASILYLIQHRELKHHHAGNFYHRLPSLEALEKLISQPILWGVPLLLAAIGIGFVWSKSVFGEFWFWDVKTLATFFVAALYFLILYLHSMSSVRGRRVALMSVFAFALVLFCFVGTRFISGSHHFLQ